MTSVPLHHQLVRIWEHKGCPLSKPQRQNLALLCQALALSPNCHLGTLALYFPIASDRDSLVERLRRLLKNPSLSRLRSYPPLCKLVLSEWDGRELCLVMDRTDIERRWSILSVGVAYHHRVVPLAWQTLPFGGTSAQAQQALLQQVKPWLPTERNQPVRVYWFADSEFRSVEIQRLCRRWHWHWQVGLKSDLLFHTDDHRWRALRELTLQPGQRRYLQAVTLTEKHAFTPVNLIADWSANTEHPRYFALDLPADRQAWRRGRKRFWIEPTFRDWKSMGFDLENTQIDDRDRLQVLLLGVVLTNVWMLSLGQWLVSSGKRPLLEAQHKRDFSLFRLGRDYVQRAHLMDWPIPVRFQVRYRN